jgi:hypothetical protein
MSKANKSPPSFEAGVREDGWRGLRLAVLCIVVGEYAKHNKLSNTVSDAEAICKAVNECVGCRAAIIRDPANTSTIRKLLRDDFLKLLAESPPEVVVIIVAGHGLQRGQHVYLIPIKAAIEDEIDEEDRLSHLKVFEWLHKFLDASAKTFISASSSSSPWTSAESGLTPKAHQVASLILKKDSRQSIGRCVSPRLMGLWRRIATLDHTVGWHLVCGIHQREYSRPVTRSSRASSMPVPLCSRKRSSVQSPLMSTRSGSSC